MHLSCMYVVTPYGRVGRWEMRASFPDLKNDGMGIMPQSYM